MVRGHAQGCGLTLDRSSCGAFFADDAPVQKTTAQQRRDVRRPSAEEGASAPTNASDEAMKVFFDVPARSQRQPYPLPRLQHGPPGESIFSHGRPVLASPVRFNLSPVNV